MALIYALLNKFAVIWPAALHVYFDLFSGAIQTYVFCMLTMTYITDACTTEEN
ncbi:MAG: ATP synthase F0 subunit A, partial [Suilimivivens sp.]